MSSILIYMNKNGNIMVIVAVVAAIVVLTIVYAVATFYGGGSTASVGVPCLVAGVELAMHIHPELKIEMDGKDLPLPTDVGVRGSCERAIHTHEDVGVIHVESQTVRDYTLGDFFDVWGEPILKDGYNAVMTIDGAPSQEFDKLILRDKQKIV